MKNKWSIARFKAILIGFAILTIIWFVAIQRIFSSDIPELDRLMIIGFFAGLSYYYYKAFKAICGQVIRPAKKTAKNIAEKKEVQVEKNKAEESKVEENSPIEAEVLIDEAQG